MVKRSPFRVSLLSLHRDLERSMCMFIMDCPMGPAWCGGGSKEKQMQLEGQGRSTPPSSSSALTVAEPIRSR